MPNQSEKSVFINNYVENAIRELCSLNSVTENDDTEKADEILEDLTMVLAVADAYRFRVPFIRHSVPKSTYFLRDVLPNLDEKRFQQIVRVSRKNFKKILDLIKNDEVFNGVASGKQFPIETQLAITLYRLGSSGEGATIAKTASLFGIGDGRTIQTITDRVFNSILKLKDGFLYWPSSSERKLLVSETTHELPYCIGYVDVMEVKLAEKPMQDPESYLSRKHVYSMKVQVICDHKLRVRHLIVGYPGSVHDARIYNNSELAIRPQKYFGEHEWIAGDSAYKLTSTVVTPFQNPSTGNVTKSCKIFNRNLSRYRVRVEHCFMFLKDRFNSLKELRISIRDDSCIKKACRWILVCAILHNIILHQEDQFSIERLSSTPSATDENARHNISNMTGEAKRRHIMNLMNIKH